MADKQQETLRRAYVSALRSNAELLIAWKAGLPAARLAELGALEQIGARIGLSLNIPKDVWIFVVTVTDAAGGVLPLCEIDPNLPAGGSFGVN